MEDEEERNELLHPTTKSQQQDMDVAKWVKDSVFSVASDVPKQFSKVDVTASKEALKTYTTRIIAEANERNEKNSKKTHTPVVGQSVLQAFPHSEIAGGKQGAPVKIIYQTIRPPDGSGVGGAPGGGEYTLIPASEAMGHESGAGGGIIYQQPYGVDAYGRPTQLIPIHYIQQPQHIVGGDAKASLKGMFNIKGVFRLIQPYLNLNF